MLAAEILVHINCAFFHVFDLLTIGARPNCLDQLSSPVLHKLIVDEVLGNCTGKSDSVLSIKGVGSQGDGSAQILCRSAAQQAKVGFH